MLEWTLNEAALYTYTYQPESLFDTYENTTITLTLPDGVTIVEGVANTLVNTQVSHDGNRWTLTLPAELPADTAQSNTIIVPLDIGRNGLRPVGEQLDFSADALDASLHTSFTIQDKTVTPAVASGLRYEKAVAATGDLGVKTITTDDVWGIEKTPGTAVPSADKQTVTVTFGLTVGLLEDGQIVTNANSYGRTGRVPFDTVTLTETPTVVDRQGQPITPQSIRVIPQFDPNEAFPVSAGSPATLPMDTVAEHVDSTPSVDADAPYLSSYTVEIVYPYEAFIAEYYDADQSKLTVANTAVLTYRLQGQTQDTTAQDTAQVQAGEVTQPAVIQIRKYIQGEDNKTHLYSAANFAQDAVSGAANFTITDEAGQPATIYQKQADGTYQQAAGNTVQIDPAGENTAGTVNVYLDPGTYTVQETGLPANTEKVTGGANNAEDKQVTAAAGQTQYADFYNKEQLGRITITKNGERLGVTEPLAGASFALYQGSSATGTPYRLQTSGSDGKVIFDRLPYGTYTVVETDAPDGYIKDTQTYSFKLTADAADGAQTITNPYNLGWVTLQKQMFDGETYVDVSGAYVAEFNGAFALQQKVGNDWWPVAGNGNIFLNTQGAYSTSLPVYDDTGVPITYRFLETLPAGWHDPAKTTAQTMVSEEFTLEQVLGKGLEGAKEVVMQNDRNGTLTVTKEFWRRQTAGFQKEANRTATFTLYRKTGSGTVEQIGEPETFTGSYTFRDLARTDSNGTAYQYYLVETPVAGYEADTSTGTEGITLPGGTTATAWGPFRFDAQDGEPAVLDQSVTVKNYAQTLPVTIKKQNSVTGAFVSGASFTVYAYDNGQKGDVVVGSTQITGAAGVTLQLEAGKKYIVKETTVPAGYTDVTLPANCIIDLTAWQKVDGSMTYTPVTVTLQNQPDSQLQVNKTLQGAGTSKPLRDVTFTVYTKQDDGNFAPLTDGSDASVTLTAGTAKSLPAGTYWLKEEVPQNNPNGVLDPSAYQALYNDHGERSGNSFYFGPFILREATTDDLLIQQVSVTNYAAAGAVTVNKKAKDTSGALRNLNGATLAIYKANASGVPTGDALATGKSADDGSVTFSDLPIYDENGKKITYVIRETAAPSGFSVTDEQLTVQLIPGTVVYWEGQWEESWDENQKVPLQLVDLPVVSFQVEKVFYNIWEHQFSNRAFWMPGAQIALYAKQADGTYAFQKLATTEEQGTVLFEKLDQKTEYVAVEYAIPDVEEYRYLEPENGGKYLITASANGGATPPATLTADELDQYYYVTKPALTGDANPEEMVQRTLTNVEHWAQLHIEKFVIEDKTQDKFPASGVNDGDKRNINNAAFDLYMQVLPEGTGTDAVLTYNDTNAKAETDGYTHIGSYTSGTLYDKDGERLDGWFGTNILKAADDVVYWLVERTGGTGAKIDPAHEVTLIRRAGTSYTNNSQSVTAEPGTPCNVFMEYQNDQVTKGSVQNIPVYGGGGSMFSTVRIVKWAGTLDEDGNRIETYSPLGNATFELWAVHKDGTLVEKLDTLTTGLDNDLSQGQTGEDTKLTSWASSKSFNFTTLDTQLKPKNTANEDKDIIWTDENGNGYVRVMLVESSAPAGYQSIPDGLRLLMYFDKEADVTTETFNDAYYVKEADTKEPLSEDQGEDVWAFYPTKETEPGTYAPLDEVQGTTTQYRIADWPVDNFAVTVNKYGYEVNAQTLGRDSAELNKYYLTTGGTGRESLEVTMELQRWSAADNAWKEYIFPRYGETASNGQFTTENGTFSFPRGLTVGRYRIIELGTVAGYDNIYDGAELTGSDAYYDVRAYYFQVTNQNLTLDLYNPKQGSLTLQKTDTEDTQLGNVTFQLKPAGSGTALTAASAADGSASFANVASGVYTLSEQTAASGYSKAYLAKYLQSAYATDHSHSYQGTVAALNKTYNLAQFAGAGIFLGYETKLENGQVLVTEQVTLKDYGISDLILDLEDPALCSLTIQKTDADTGETLQGATFQLAYKAFATWSGAENVYTTGTWTTGKNVTTGADGTVQVTGLEPGVYRVTETAAPAGYDKTAPAQYVVLTGGMDKTVTLTGGTLSNAGDPLTFADDRQVNLTLTKKVNTGALTVEGNHSFTFTLYEADKKTVVGTKNVTVTAGAKNDDTFPVTDATSSYTFTGLSQGQTYCLKETENTQGAAAFALTAVTGDAGLTVTGPDEDGYYTFTVPDDGKDITATATNTYLYAEVTIRKVNGENGESLPGARFDAYRQQSDGSFTTATGTWTDDTPSGEHTVRLPLTSPAGNVFQIQERVAPVGYVNTHAQTTVTVTPGQKLKYSAYNEATMATADKDANDAAMLEALLFPNYKGSTVEITKYNSTKEVAAAGPVAMQAVPFTLYSKEAAGGSWQLVATQSTDASGTVSFTVSSGKIYAVAETVPTGYAAMQGLYKNDTAMPTETATVNGTALTLYLLNGGAPLAVDVSYTYSAYNIPWVDLTIRKQDARNPNATDQPTAVAALYEVPGTTGQSLTEAQVLALMQTENLLQENIQVNQPGADQGAHFRYITLTDRVQPGKTYLVVETSSSISQIRDNRQVEWYKVFTVPLNTTATQVVTLKNIKGSASSSLTKVSSSSGEHESLLTAPADLSYTITPTVGTNVYPLNSFVLKDTGLTATSSSNTTLDFDTYLKDRYSITQVEVGKAVHETTNYADTANMPISAQVIFYDFAGNILQQSTVDVSQAGQTVVLTEAGKAKWVEIRYESEAFRAATGYALGQNFTPGQVKVAIHMDQQTGGAGVAAIAKVRNTAQTVMKYTPWSGTGSKLGERTVTHTAGADDRFHDQKYAKVSVTKESDKGTLNLKDDVATYTITITNAADAEAPLGAPFLVDLLPQGTLLDGDAQDAVSLGSAPKGLVIENIRTETRNGETALFVFLNGDDGAVGQLAPGESAEVKVRVKTTTAVAAYGASIVNYVLMGSRVQGVQSASNPLATSWMTSDGKMPGGLDSALTNLASQRLENLRAMLDTFAGFGYISAAAQSSWTATSEAAVTKMGRGDRTQSQQTGFTTDQLSLVNNNGYMDYQLLFSNLSATYSYTGVTLLDVLPYLNDETSTGSDRGSAWSMLFGGITSVEKVAADGTRTPVPAGSYKLLCYTAPIDENTVDAVYAQVGTLSYAQTPPTGWQAATDSGAGLTGVTAIALVFQKAADVSLAANESYAVTYRMNVGNLTEAELADRAWSNTVNTFTAQFWRYTGNDVAQATQANTRLGSNPVSGTILPEPVKVGGHIWIDKDADGVWETGESVDLLTSNAMVQKLLDNIEIRLNVYQGSNGTAGHTELYDTAADPDWHSQANFTFDELNPASPLGNVNEDGDELYDTSKGQLDQLIPQQLKGTAPNTYQLSATIPSTAGVLAAPTSLGSTTGRSRVPETLQPGGTNAAEAADNNFARAGTSATASRSERFYLHATDPDVVFDNTKDLGLVLYRQVTIEKTAADDASTKVENASFTVYGPFATLQEAQTDPLTDPAKVVGTYTTDADGKAALGTDGLLNWFQYYVIVESSAPTGYVKDLATATSADGVLAEYTGTATQDPAWVLTVPDETVVATEQVLQVENVREIPVTLQADKTLAGQTLQAGQFTFLLQDANGITLDTATNDADGHITFTSLTLHAPGSYEYFISEQRPANLDSNGRLNGVWYDTAVFKAQVDVKMTSTGLQADVTYYQQTAAGQWTKVSGAVFANEYEAAPAGYAPMVEKRLQTAGQTTEESFTFTLTRTDTGAASAVIMPDPATVSIQGTGKAAFGTIRFQAAGTYTFAIREQSQANLEAFGYTFDPTVWTLTVQVEDDGQGSFQVTDTRYTPDDGRPAVTDQAVFINQYEPHETTYSPRVEKTITGTNAPANAVFRFALALTEESVSGGAILAADPGASITGAGSVTLPQIRFRAAGRYTFAITEYDDGLPGFTYDNASWKLVVQVEQAADGSLTVTSATYRKGWLGLTQEAAQFTNHYRETTPPTQPPTNPPTAPTATPTATPVTAPGVPRTGDSFPLTPMVILLVASAGGLIGLWWFRKHRNDRET